MTSHDDEQAMRELATLAFDSSSLDRSGGPADAGPIRRIPERIALCSAHGWWFPIDAFTEERCPERGCQATIHYYMHRGLYTPEASS